MSVATIGEGAAGAPPGAALGCLIGLAVAACAPVDSTGVLCLVQAMAQRDLPSPAHGVD